MKIFITRILKLLKWLFKWIKYFIIILICFIYSLFHQEKSEKLERKKENLKHEIKREEKSSQTSTPFNDSNSLIKDSIFKITEEKLKEEIKNFYCKEKEKKVYELTKEDNEIIRKLTEILVPIITLELNKKHIPNQEKLKEKITKLGKENLNLIEAPTNVIDLVTSSSIKGNKDTEIIETPISLKEKKKEETRILDNNKIKKTTTAKKQEVPIFRKNSIVPSKPLSKEEECTLEKTPKFNSSPSFIVSPSIAINLTEEKKKETITSMSIFSSLQINISNVNVNIKM